ncbi:MAG: hypothetical protein PHD15_02495 [Clostridia bacterium]|nr:hypothetical protein [Clostridia bacterium]MDD4386616.1 hypothetical protein [Clostridia bacterium]
MNKKSILNQQVFNDIQRAVKIQVESTKEIFNCTDEKALSVFSRELTKNMIQAYHQQLKTNEGYSIASTSASNMPTRNIREALIKSNISENGLLPEKRCYLAEFSEGEGYFTDQNEYDNEKKVVESRIANIFNWVKENEETDPNLNELMDIFITAGKFENDLSQNTIEQLQYLKEKRMDDLVEKVGINKEDELYKMCNEICENTLQGVPTTYSTNVKEYVCKLAGVNLYIGQMKRDDKNFSYDNEYEFQQISILKKQAEKEQVMIPLSCEKVVNNIDKNLQRDKGFIGELKKLTVAEPIEYSDKTSGEDINIKELS